MNYYSRAGKILNLSLLKSDKEKRKDTESAIVEWIQSCPTPSAKKRRSDGH